MGGSVARGANRGRGEVLGGGWRGGAWLWVEGRCSFWKGAAWTRQGGLGRVAVAVRHDHEMCE